MSAGGEHVGGRVASTRSENHQVYGKCAEIVARSSTNSSYRQTSPDDCVAYTHVHTILAPLPQETCC